MFKNYIKIALRTLTKQKGYTFINVVGLATGLACFILITLFVQHEYAYDKFYADADRIHRVILHQPGNVYLGSDYYAVTPPPLAGVLRNDYPEIESATSLRNRSALLSYDDRHFWEEGIWADEHFFEVFSLDLDVGHAASALSSPNTIVLTESLAEKIFGSADPMHQVIVVGDDASYTVTGILPNQPASSSIKFDFLTSHISHNDFARRVNENLWGSSNVHTFFLLKKGEKIARFQSKLPGLVETNVYGRNSDTPPENRDQYFVQQLSDIHLGAYLNFDVGFQGETKNGVKGQKKYIYFFMAIGWIILLLACINYMNLAIARSMKRAQEVGLRKAVGASRWQIIGQFLSESIMIAMLSLGIAILLVQVLLPFFSQLVDRTLQLDYGNNLLLIPLLVLLSLMVGLISGSYPALYMSALKPVRVLKGQAISSTSRFGLQRVLIVGQYTASIALIVCGVVIFQQLNYMRTKDLGYDLDYIVTARIQQDNNVLRTSFDRVHQAWLDDARVSAVSASSSLPVYVDWQAQISGWHGSSQDDFMAIYLNPVSYDYFELFGIDVVAGRPFSREYATDLESAAIINETAAKERGWTPQEAIGQQFIEGRGSYIRTIIGVVKDTHTHTMHMEIKPLVHYLTNYPGSYGPSINYFAAKIQSDDIEETLANMDNVLSQFTPYPIEYRFLNDQFDTLYKSDQSLGETIGFFTILALLIASLGLFGLAAYAAERRTKEVGVRKILGASSSGIIYLLLKEFVLLVVLASILGSPIAYFMMQRWLEGFAFRIEIGPAIFILATSFSLLIAVVTVGHQTLKTALANPVQSLRYE